MGANEDKINENCKDNSDILLLAVGGAVQILSSVAALVFIGLNFIM